jgi:hypothetical protein
LEAINETNALVEIYKTDDGSHEYYKEELKMLENACFNDFVNAVKDLFEADILIYNREEFDGSNKLSSYLLGSNNNIFERFPGDTSTMFYCLSQFLPNQSVITLDFTDLIDYNNFSNSVYNKL